MYDEALRKRITIVRKRCDYFDRARRATTAGVDLAPGREGQGTCNDRGRESEFVSTNGAHCEVQRYRAPIIANEAAGCLPSGYSGCAHENDYLSRSMRAAIFSKRFQAGANR